MKINNKYIQSIAILASGSVLGQVIGFIGSMFMTRIYTQVEIGIMTTIVAVSGIFAPVINGRFDFAVVKEQDPKRVLHVVSLAILFGTILSIIVSLGSIVYFYSVDEFMSAPIAALFVLLILIIQAFTNVFKSYNNNIGDYKTMTWVIVLRKLAEEISMVVFGLLSCGSIGLLVSRVIGQMAGLRREMRNIKHQFSEILKVKKSEIVNAFNIHKRQLYYSTPAALLNAASYSMISLFIGQLYGMQTVGLYAISFAVLGLPLSVISGNVSKVYFSEASKEAAKEGSFHKCTMKTLYMMIPLAFLLWIAMYYIVPMLIPYVYGKNYLESGVFVQILAIMFAIRFVSSSLNTGLVVANKQFVELIVQVWFIISLISVFIYAKHNGLGIRGFLMGCSITYSIIYAVNLLFIIKYSRAQIVNEN